MSTANKILMGAGGAAGGGPSDDEFNRVSFLSHFDGENNGVNNVFDDGSASNHTITAVGNVTQGSFGPFARPDGEWGVSFDGTNDGLRLQSSDFGISTEAFTAECWVFPTKVPDNSDSFMWCMDASQENASGNTWAVRANSGKVQIFTVSSAGLVSKNSTASLNINAWNHVAISRSGTTMYVALNGTVESATCASSLNNQQYLHIGCAAASNYAYFFQGIISNARYLVGTALYTSDYTVPTSKLTAITNTDLLTCQSNRFVDNSASGHAITITGEPAVTAFGPFLTSAVYDPAVNGASAYFDGSGESLVVDATVISQSGNFTFEGWAYSNSTDSQTIGGQYSGGGTGRMVIYSDSGNIRFYQNASPAISYNGSSGKLLNQWCHFVLMRTGSNIALYINGVRVHNVTAANIEQSDFIVGAENSSGNNSMNGYISNIRCTSSAVYSEGTSITVPTAPYSTVTNTNLLLNMADGQAIDSAAQHNLSLENGTNISTAQAKFGNSSLYFDGTTDTATVIDSENVNFGTANFTVEGWIRPASFSGYKPNIISKWTNGSRGWAVRLVASGSGFVMRFTFSTDGSNDSSLDATTVLAFDTFHHFAFVQNSNTVTCYSNGTANGTISCSTIFASTNPIILGDWDTNQADYNGYIDEIRVTTGFARYTSNFTAPTAAFPDKGQDA